MPRRARSRAIVASSQSNALASRSTMKKLSTKAQRELEARDKAAFEAGLEHHSTRPDDLLVEVWRHATKQYATKREAFEFVMGYSTARARRDDYLREQSSP